MPSDLALLAKYLKVKRQQKMNAINLLDSRTLEQNRRRKIGTMAHDNDSIHLSKDKAPLRLAI